MKPLKKLLTLMLTLMLLLPAVSLGETVVTSFYPIYLFALNLTDGIEDLTVHNLAAPTTGCLHDYQLTAADMKALNKADVFLINGAGMESYLQMAMDAFPALPVVDASTGITLLPEEDDLDDEEDDDDDDHDHGEWNAHIWLSAANASQMVSNLAEGLMAALPEKAEAIAANRDAYLERLAALDAELTEGLAPVAGKSIVTFHEAFPYFAQAYGLNIAAVINREPDDALSPRALARLVQQVKALNNPPLFTEPLYGDIAATTIARETGAAIYSLDPIVSGPVDPTPLTYYEDTMRLNMQTLLEALSD